MNKSIFRYSPRRLFGAIKRYLIRQRRAQLKQRKIAFFLQEGPEILNRIASVFNSEGILFWLEFGSLLGYYRENDFLKHDDDFDFGFLLMDAEKVRRVLLDSGFELIRLYRINDGSGIEECYRYKTYHTTIDVYYFEIQDQEMICYGFKPQLNMYKKSNLRKDVPFSVRRMRFPYSGFTKVLFKDVFVYIPTNTSRHLASHYGPNFMVPNSSFDNSEAGNVELLSYDSKPATGWFKYGYNDLVK